jgi:hypothetical protein
VRAVLIYYEEHLYGSEQNYEFMEEKRIEVYVKYNYFHK